MKSPHFIPQRLLTGALVCFSCLGAFAQTPPTTPVAPNPVIPPTNPVTPVAVTPPVKPAPLQLPKTLTNLNISYPAVPYGESVKLLDAKVSFKVKDASFLAALDGVLSSANITCNVECRGVKAMKLSLDLKEVAAGPLLDGLAKVGGARLWVFATKLLIAPEALLTKDEKKNAKLYGVLLTEETLLVNGPLKKGDKGASLLDVANTKISIDLNNLSWNDVWGKMINAPKKNNGMSMSLPESTLTGLTSPPVFSASFQDISYADAMAFVAHAGGCELYILPNSSHFAIFPPGMIPPERNPTSIYTPSSTHFDFGPNPILNPSAKGS